MVNPVYNATNVMVLERKYARKTSKLWSMILISLAKSCSGCRCKKCKGRKTVTEKKRQEIFIEKGMTDKQRIVLAGEGDQTVS